MPSAMKAQWFHILLSLADRDLHGTAIMEEVLERTDETVKLWPTTLYGSLRDLSERGWIEETEPPEGASLEGGKRRFYRITDGGRESLASEVSRMESYLRAARAKQVGAA